MDSNVGSVGTVAVADDFTLASRNTDTPSCFFELRCRSRAVLSDTDGPSSCVAASVVHVTSALLSVWLLTNAATSDSFSVCRTRDIRFAVGVVTHERCHVGFVHDPSSCGTRGIWLTLGCTLPPGQLMLHAGAHGDLQDLAPACCAEHTLDVCATA